jgi:saccharopine dehydrogenase-like NADP-dependent oxidoreductase
LTPGELAVAVLGAGGTIAPAVVRDLAESEEVSSLGLLDLDPERALAVAERHGLGKATVYEADARSGLGDAVEKFDVLVNAASYRVNVDAMRACLWGDCHYIDLGGLYWQTGRQLELDGEFRRAGLLALLGMGSSPGKTNVMAVQAVRALGEEPRELHVMAAGRDLSPPRGATSFPYAVRTLVDEVTMRPVVVERGEQAELEPLADGGEVDFGEPIGRSRTIFTLHSELRTFPSSFHCAGASFRLSLAPAVLKEVRRLAGTSEDKVEKEVEAAARAALPPSSNTVATHVVEAGADGRMVRVRAVTRPLERWGLGGGVVSTGAPAAAAVRLLARGSISATGVAAPEACVDPDDLFPELEAHGTTFEVTEQEAVAS